MPFILCLLGFWVIGLPVGIMLDWMTDLGPYAYWIALIAGLMSNCFLLMLRLRKVQIKFDRRESLNG